MSNIDGAILNYSTFSNNNKFPVKFDTALDQYSFVIMSCHESNML